MNPRRRLLIGIGALIALPSLAQQSAAPRRVAYFDAGSPSSGYPDALRKGMAQLGWVEGRDYTLTVRHAGGDRSAMDRLADEVLAGRPEVVVVPAEPAALVIMKKSKSTPVVFAIASDPVGAGIAASLQKPGGSATGMSTVARELSVKRLQLLKDAFPRVSSVGVLHGIEVGASSQLEDTQRAAKTLGMRVIPLQVRQLADIEASFKRGAGLGVQAYLPTSGVLLQDPKNVLEHARRARVPAIFQLGSWVDAGGLMSYGIAPGYTFVETARYVDKILKGAKPGDLPIGEPTRFELAINVKTAKAMGLTIPQSVLLRADRVIE